MPCGAERQRGGRLAPHWSRTTGGGGGEDVPGGFFRNLDIVEPGFAAGDGIAAKEDFHAGAAGVGGED